MLTLLGWLFAAGHVALRHGGVAQGGSEHAAPGAAHGDDHDDNAPSQDGEGHHHHDFAAVDGGQWSKAVDERTLAPVWMSLVDMLADRLAEREERQPRLLPTREHAPPDERAFGWLFVCQTALPVRGPSLAV